MVGRLAGELTGVREQGDATHSIVSMLTARVRDAHLRSGGNDAACLMHQNSDQKPLLYGQFLVKLTILVV